MPTRAAPDIAACGAPGVVDSACQGVDDCGTPPNRLDAECPFCSDLSRTSFCSAGRCNDFGQLSQVGQVISLLFQTTLEQQMRARSAVMQIMAPVTSDGRALSCAVLERQDGCDPVLEEISVVNTSVQFGTFTDGRTFSISANVPPGDWIVSFELLSTSDDDGESVGFACVDRVTLTSAGELTVDGAPTPALEVVF